MAAVRYVPAARLLIATPEDTAAIVPAQVFTLQAFLLYAIGASAGILLGGVSRRSKKISRRVHGRFTPSVLFLWRTIHQGVV